MLVFTPAVVVVLLWFISLGHSKVQFNSNGYENIVVVLSTKANESLDVISRIQSEVSDLSIAIAKATNGWATIKTVRIVVPSSWTLTAGQFETGLTGDDADIEINDLDNGGDQISPYVIDVEQPFGCGQPGTKIFISKDLSHSTFRSVGKKLLQKWAQFRYGVFEEWVPVPTSQQEMMATPYRRYYPVALAKDVVWKPSVCSTAVKSLATRPDGGQCIVKDQWLDYLCQISLDPIQDAVSSFLFTSDVEGITQFCKESEADSGEKHNVYAMNRHNHMCNFQSTWAVVLKSPDFINYRPVISPARPPTPVFQIARNTASKRVVFLIDISRFSTWTILDHMNSLAKKAIASLPYYSTVAVVPITSYGKVSLHPMQVFDPSSYKVAADSLPKVPDDTSCCLSCAIDTASKLIQNQLSGALFVILSVGTWNTGTDPRLKIHDLAFDGVQVNSVSVGSAESPLLADMAALTGGKAFFNPNGNAVPDRLLVNELIDSTRASADIWILSRELFVSHSQTNGTVTVDATAGNFVHFVVDYETSNLVVSFTSPSGVTSICGSNGFSYDMKNKLFHFTEWKDARGTWTYNIEQPGYQFNIHDLISSQQNNVRIQAWTRQSNSGDTLSLRLRIHPSNLDFAAATVSTPVVTLCGILRIGKMPVLNATMVAVVTNLNNVTGGQSEVPLYDKGYGADLTKDDGIYCGYFTRFSEQTSTQHYVVHLHVREEEHAVRYVGTQPVNIGKFSRIDVGSFDVNNWKPTNTSLPGKVNDLHVVGIDSDTNTVTLRWTAPGRNLDQGAVVRYAVYLSQNLTEMTGDRFVGMTMYVTPQPARPGDEVRANIMFRPTGVFYVQISGIGDRHKAGPRSNVAVVLIQKSATTKTTTVTATPSAGTTTEAATRTSETPAQRSTSHPTALTNPARSTPAVSTSANPPATSPASPRSRVSPSSRPTAATSTDFKTETEAPKTETTTETEKHGKDAAVAHRGSSRQVAGTVCVVALLLYYLGHIPW